MVAMTRQSFQHEGDGMVYNTTEGAQKEVDYNKIESSFSFSRDQIKSLKIEDILKKVDSAAQELSDHMARTIFAAIERGTKEAGTQVDAGGRPFLPEVLFDALEKISIDFDEETGEPLMPSVFVSPEVAAQIQDKLPEWERNEEYKKRHDEIMKRKYEEWNARESNRKLVD
ncbi:MAG: hypothetical protein HYX84_04635 [Chloroflexi bacterium]|nr:hypothetical protein [Chloroflexota bacterium]